MSDAKQTKVKLQFRNSKRHSAQENRTNTLSSCSLDPVSKTTKLLPYTLIDLQQEIKQRAPAVE